MARLCSGRYLKSSSRIYYTEIIIEKEARVECPATRVQNCFQSSQRVIEGAKLQRLPGRLVRRAQEESPLARNDPTFCISPKSATHLNTLDPTLLQPQSVFEKDFYIINQSRTSATMVQFSEETKVCQIASSVKIQCILTSSDTGTHHQGDRCLPSCHSLVSRPSFNFS
jgi:hypothetical protein